TPLIGPAVRPERKTGGAGVSVTPGLTPPGPPRAGTACEEGPVVLAVKSITKGVTPGSAPVVMTDRLGGTGRWALAGPTARSNPATRSNPRPVVRPVLARYALVKATDKERSLSASVRQASIFISQSPRSGVNSSGWAGAGVAHTPP